MFKTKLLNLLVLETEILTNFAEIISKSVKYIEKRFSLKETVFNYFLKLFFLCSNNLLLVNKL